MTDPAPPYVHSDDNSDPSDPGYIPPAAQSTSHGGYTDCLLCGQRISKAGINDGCQALDPSLFVDTCDRSESAIEARQAADTAEAADLAAEESVAAKSSSSSRVSTPTSTSS